jgi:hypothetical protein
MQSARDETPAPTGPVGPAHPTPEAGSRVAAEGTDGGTTSPNSTIHSEGGPAGPPGTEGPQTPEARPFNSESDDQVKTSLAFSAESTKNYSGEGEAPFLPPSDLAPSLVAMAQRICFNVDPLDTPSVIDGPMIDDAFGANSASGEPQTHTPDVSGEEAWTESRSRTDPVSTSPANSENDDTYCNLDSQPEHDNVSNGVHNLESERASDKWFGPGREDREHETPARPRPRGWTGKIQKNSRRGKGSTQIATGRHRMNDDGQSRATSNAAVKRGPDANRAHRRSNGSQLRELWRRDRG